MTKIDYTEVTVKLMDEYTSKYLQENAELVQDTIKATLEAINYSHCCKSDSEQLPSKDDVYSEIKRVTELYYNDDNARKSAFGLGFSTGVNFVNKDILK